LLQIKSVFESNDKGFWDDLPGHVKVGIEQGRKQAEEGMVTPHEEVIRKFTL
jgi:hypothetical protein